MTFAELELAPNILKAVSDCGYETPTPIQEKAIPLALQGRDLVATAQTGTGKTAAFVLPSLQRLAVRSEMRGIGPRILVLTPTRELAGQVTDAVRTYGRYIQVKCGTILGGMPYREQLRILSRPVDLIVATPGRLIDYLDRGKIDLSRVEALILDEADRMLDMGFTDAVDRIAASLPAGRQTLMFTATMDRETAKLAGRLLNNPERVEIAPEQMTHENIEQRLHLTDDLAHKQRLLRHLVEGGEVSKAIIFSATKRDADALAVELKAEGHSVAALHGDMNQRARNRTIEDMRRGKIRLLIATDVAARGLDVTGISHVINYDLPKFAEDYVHRIGRTGRAGASGVAISFASYNEISYLDRIEKYLGQRLPEQRIPGFEPVRTFARLGKGTGRPGKPFEKRHQGSNGRSTQQRDVRGDSRGGQWGKKPNGSAPVVVYRKPGAGRHIA